MVAAAAPEQEGGKKEERRKEKWEMATYVESGRIEQQQGDMM